MIIKSKTYRYKPNLYKKLIDYTFSDKGRAQEEKAWSFFHNLSTFTPDGIETAFEENNTFRKKRVNGIALRHLILSFSPDDTPYLTPEIIQDLVEKFLELRGEKGIVIGRLHEHDKHIHVHLLISGNQYRSPKSTCMSKKDFLDVHRELEIYQKRPYPQLKHSLVKIEKRPRDPERIKPLSELELKMKERLGKKLTKKERFRQRIKTFLDQAKSTVELYDLLEKNGFELYQYRKRINGILKDGIKFRFTTLGIKPSIIRELDRERTKRLSVLQATRISMNRKDIQR